MKASIQERMKTVERTVQPLPMGSRSDQGYRGAGPWPGAWNKKTLQEADLVTAMRKETMTQ